MEKAIKVLIFLLSVIIGLGLSGCPTSPGTEGNPTENPNPGTNPGNTGISWSNEANGTLRVANNTSKDMILFIGQTPSPNSIIGGVKAGTTKTFDISDDVDDFNVGGYLILRGISNEEYEKNKANLSLVKIEYSAMATYRSGQRFSTEINPAYTGDYYYRVTNGGRIGIELRKNSPDGEKIGYLPALATNYYLYSSTPDDITIFPVYVFYSNITKEVTTIRPTSIAESASVGPRPIGDSSLATVRFPNDAALSWAQIVGSIKYPVAFIKVINNVMNQSAAFQSASRVYFAQNGYNSINSGETLTFEILASDTGQQLLMNLTIYGGNISIPIRNGGTVLAIKNGYDYTVTLNYVSGPVDNASSYTAEIIEVGIRDVSGEISSL